jgi:ABC-type lipoprotein release transport system permease subunit
VVVGRWAWQLVANQIGSVQSPAVPITAVTITLPAAMIVATLAALVAAWQAASVRPSAALAQE